VSDKKFGVDINSDGVVDYYTADVLTATDYTPFGMQLVGRTYRANNSYRYGFNGKENDNEVKGEGNEIDYGRRIYDPRLGRFLSVDPLTGKFAHLTPYQYASNNPIAGIDIDGLEFYKANDYLIEIRLNYDAQLKKITAGGIVINKFAVQPELRNIIENFCDHPNGVDCGGADIMQIQYKALYVFNKPREAEMGDIDDPNAVGPDNMNLPIVPKNGTQEREQRRTKQFTEPVMEGNNTKGGAIVAAVDLVGQLLEKLGQNYVKQTFKDAVTQGYQSQTAIDIVQNAIDKGKIPGEYLNGYSLAKITDYIMGSVPIEKINDKGEVVTDEKLTAVAKQIWSDWHDPIVKREYEQRQKEHERAPVDNTSVKRN
jgi:RHS repeat-associated protein